MKKFYISFLLVFLTFLSLSSQTNVPEGDVYGTWTQEGSPYLIQGEINIPNNETLTIDPGVLVEFQDYYKLNVQGQILAIGTENDSIYFTVDDTTGFSDFTTMDGGWHGIRFNETPAENDSSKIIFCNIQYGKAQGGSYNQDGAAFYIRNFSKVLVSNCLVKNCIVEESGGAILCLYSDPIIIENKFALNKNAIYCYSSNPEIINNIIESNSRYGIYCLHYSSQVCNPFISNNLIQYNKTGIVCANGTSPTIINNVIQYNSNSNSDGGGIRTTFHSHSIILNNIIKGNIAESGGGISCYSSDPIIVNNLMINNEAINGGAIYCYLISVPEIINNTICDNIAEFGGACYIDFLTEPKFINSILWNNSASECGNQIYIDYSYPSNTSFYYCNIEGGVEAFGLPGGASFSGFYDYNINTDPLFMDEGDFPYSLSGLSPCIVAGDPDTTNLHLPDIDLACNQRVANGRIDIGAYEYPQHPDFVLTPIFNPQPGLYQETIELVINTLTDGASIYYTVDGSEPTIYSFLYIEPIEISESVMIRARGFHDDLEPSPIVTGNYYIDEYNIIVDVNGSGDYITIHEAIEAANDEATIIVRDGIYTGLSNINLTWNGNYKHLTVKSENGPENCIIDCNQSGRAFNFDETGQDPTDIIDSFKIINGHTFDGTGAGILCNETSPTIINNIISNSYSGNPGGGIALINSSSLVKKNIISYNHASSFFNIGTASGGGIYISGGTPEIVDNIIQGNITENTDIEGWATGGGIAIFDSDALIKNNIILDNSSITYSGIGGSCIYYIDFYNEHLTIIENNTVCSNAGNGIYVRRNVIVRNNIISQNQGNGISANSYYNDNTEIYNNNVWGNDENFLNCPEGVGDTSWGINNNGTPCDMFYNISEDPLFIYITEGDYFLSQIEAGQDEQSPCVNAGSGNVNEFNLQTYTTRTDFYSDIELVDIGYHYPDGIVITSNDNEYSHHPLKFQLSNYPNPFNSITNITFQINTENTEKTEINIYNIKGQKIRKLSVDNRQSLVFWDGRDNNNKPVSSGIYFFQLKLGNKVVDTKRCLLLK
ncbi:MAG: right-handed parallel beta-helix repeat-containing protein [Candidatus Cloacimonetes bacterium]|nr:right-handed parallel beta-helix repeat-containing protein [Candidatus Cloacimonadota bacterium]MBL7087156.1 right-handed parallel beta-helix repeat-containing protein [Candidatus Cloacimonadota bacterium]